MYAMKSLSVIYEGVLTDQRRSRNLGGEDP